MLAMIMALLFFAFLATAYLVDFETALLGRKPLLITIACMMIYYEIIKWTLSKIRFSAGEYGTAAAYLIPFLLGSAGTLFTYAALSSTLRGPLIKELRLCIIGSHILYISVWIFLYAIIENTLRPKYDGKRKTKLNIPAAISLVVAVGLTHIFHHKVGLGTHPPPWHIVPLHPIRLFIATELSWLVSAIAVLAVLTMERERPFAASLGLIIFLGFVFLTDVGMLALDRMRYDFFFFGPTLLFWGISGKKIVVAFANLVKRGQEVQQLKA